MSDSPKEHHERATPHKPEREPLTPIQPVPVRDVLLIASLPGIIVAIIAIIFNFLK